MMDEVVDFSGFAYDQLGSDPIAWAQIWNAQDSLARQVESLTHGNVYIPIGGVGLDLITSINQLGVYWARHDSGEGRRLLSRFQNEVSSKTLNGLEEIPEAKRIEREKALTEAAANRELMAALIDHNALGLQILAVLREFSTGIQVGDLAPRLFKSLNYCELNNMFKTLFNLLEIGLVSHDSGKCYLSTNGNKILESVEQKTGVRIE